MNIVTFTGDANTTAAYVLQAMKKDNDNFVVVPVIGTQYGAGFKYYQSSDTDEMVFEDLLVDSDTYKVLLVDEGTSQSGLEDADVLSLIAERLDLLDFEE